MVTLSLDWPLPLRHRAGARHLFAGVDVFHDFDWVTKFRHNKTAFRNGKRLAMLVTKDCPDTRKPGVILTIREDIEEEPVECEDWYLAVVKIDRYLEISAPDPAATYFATGVHLPGGMTSLGKLERQLLTAQQLDSVLDANLDAVALERWVRADPARRQLLVELAGVPTSNASSDAREGPAERIVDLLKRLEHVPSTVIQALMARIEATDNANARMLVLSGISGTTSGREGIVRVLADKLRERLDDIHNAARSYNSLIASPRSSETDVQRFIEQRPWLLGLEYVRAIRRFQVPRGELDFLLERYDGFHDFLELKGPNDEIIRSTASAGLVPGSASSYSLGPTLAQALAQIQLYREVLHHDELLGLYGVRNTRHARAFILVGRSTSLADVGARILTQLNQGLHRIEIIPYDILGQRITTWVHNLERLLTAERQETMSLDANSSTSV